MVISIEFRYLYSISDMFGPDPGAAKMCVKLGRKHMDTFSGNSLKKICKHI